MAKYTKAIGMRQSDYAFATRNGFSDLETNILEGLDIESRDWLISLEGQKGKLNGEKEDVFGELLKVDQKLWPQILPGLKEKYKPHVPEPVVAPKKEEEGSKLFIGLRQLAVGGVVKGYQKELLGIDISPEDNAATVSEKAETRHGELKTKYLIPLANSLTMSDSVRDEVHKAAVEILYDILSGTKTEGKSYGRTKQIARQAETVADLYMGNIMGYTIDADDDTIAEKTKTKIANVDATLIKGYVRDGMSDEDAKELFEAIKPFAIEKLRVAAQSKN